MSSVKMASKAKLAVIEETKARIVEREGRSGYLHRTLLGKEYFFPRVDDISTVIAGRAYFIVAADYARSGFICANDQRDGLLFNTDLVGYTIYGPVPGSLHNGIPTPDEETT